MEYLSGLNENQRLAVVNINGPSLVIAGAGSGKTRVLTYRIAHLLKSGVPAHSILALTFTNKAAREMKERIGDLVGEKVARYLWMGTFHSIFSRILRAEADALGYPSNFTIYDTSDSKNVLRNIIKDLKLDDKTYKPADSLYRISAAKNNLVTARAYMNNDKMVHADRMAGKPAIAEIFKEYTLRCYRSGAMDFDDLLLNTNVLFRDHDEILAKYQHMFRYILIDEYQDTNYAQYLIIKRLAEQHNNVTVVGDDAQSIYSFRGARIENILNFRNDYPEYKLFKLEQNYRSTQTIVNAANSLINKNEKQIPKVVYSKNDIGEKIRVLPSATDSEEGFIVANTIVDTMYSDHHKYKDYAILYRTNAQSRIFEEALRKKNIPYKVYGSISFYQRKEIKDLLAYFRLIINSKDDEALSRIINYPARGIGKVTMEKIEKTANANNVSMWQVINMIDKIDMGLNKGTTNKIKSFIEYIKLYQEKLFKLDAFDLAQEVATSSGIYRELRSDNSPESLSKLQNLEELLNAVKDFVEQPAEEGEDKLLPSFMANVALLTDQDTDDSEDRNHVTLMTVHSSKGLEFKVVFLVGLEEELFPSRMSMNTPNELEEERRLFYVALTRAEQRAYLTHAETRYRWGTPTIARPSRFIKEIDDEFLDQPEKESSYNFGGFNRNLGGFSSNDSIFSKTKSTDTGFTQRGNRAQPPAGFKKTSANSYQSSFKNIEGDDPNKIAAGMIVEHARFGQGKVIAIDGEMPNAKATVFFQSSGRKQLLLKFAKLKIIS